MRPGQGERIEFEYIRHGGVGPIVSFDVVTGKSLSPTIGPTRNEEDCLEHIKRTFALHPDSKSRLIADQLNPHWSASLEVWVILTEGSKLLLEEVGSKAKSEIPKNQKSRQAFLTAAERRIGFICVPKNSSWLNQVKIWFFVMVRRVIRHGEFTSTEALTTRLLEFVAYFNATMTKPHRWTSREDPFVGILQSCGGCLVKEF